ncbi:hypothetical protein CYMTET_13210 [Cymbomonas tetramitiformis]|uniref:Right handed beta helix domain-containing protein n=1 Tax=Cymbomonas tetramitiformis TaxID=36881 RepID=A0AAE0LBA5_9CHLO|nr:hypothetical protein CYMTET_13210 [Cymbomonas tetramitiformis]
MSHIILVRPFLCIFVVVALLTAPATALVHTSYTSDGQSYIWTQHGVQKIAALSHLFGSPSAGDVFTLKALLANELIARSVTELAEAELDINYQPRNTSTRGAVAEAGGVGGNPNQYQNVGESVSITEATAAEGQLVDALSECEVGKVVLATDIFLSSPPLVISHSVEIRGNCGGPARRCVLDGQEIGTVMLVNTGNRLDLSHVELRNGKGDEAGGLELSSGAIAHLVGCVIQRCQAVKHGGGILLRDGANLVLNGTTCANNSADKGGGVFLQGANLSVTGESSVSLNTAVIGGAIYSFPDSIINLDASTVEGNFADKGAGIFLDVRVDLRLVNGSQLIGNYAKVSGGGAHCESMFISGSVVANNTAQITGGGLFMHLDGVLTITQSQVVGNVALSDGGGVFIQGSTSLHVQSSEVAQNTAIMGGGIYLGASSNAEIRNGSRIVGNSAAAVGGGLYASGNSSVVVAESSVSSNSAAGNAGGIYGKQITVQSSTVDLNTAQKGGGLYGPRGALLRVIGASSIRSNTAEINGGGFYLEINASLVLLPTSLVSHNNARDKGGGIHAEVATRLHAEGVGMLHNTAVDGGAVYVVHASEVVVIGTRLEMNRGTGNGGGIFLGQSSRLEVRGSSLVGNEAGLSGGGIFVNVAATLMSLQDTNFTGNAAGQGNGGAVNLGQPMVEPALSLERLQLEGNRAMAGSNLYWKYSPDNLTELPLCRGCEVAGSEETELFASSAVAGALGAWSRAQETVLPPWITSATLDPYTAAATLGDYAYVLKDYYGHKTFMSAEGDCKLTVTAIARNGITIRGQVFQQFEADYALFSDLLVVGIPGSTAQLEFQPSIGEYTLVIDVVIPQCEQGDAISRDGMSCQRCPNGTISFSTDFNTSQCVSCDGVDGLQCHGGADFSVDDGYWLSEQAANAGTEVCSNNSKAKECFFKYIYPCDIDSACTSDTAGRQGTGPESVSLLQLCGAGHAKGTVLCGSCQEGYEYVMSECIRCPEDAAKSWAQAMAILVVVPGAFLLVTLSLQSFGKLFVALQGDLKQVVVITKRILDSLKPQLEFVSAALAIFLRYLQTLVPILQLFQDSLTGQLLHALRYLGWIAVPVGAMISRKCLAYNLQIDAPGEFYSEFAFKLSMPLVILLGLGGLMKYYTVRAERLRAADNEEGLKAVNAVKLNLVTVAVFLLQFIYPSVCIFCFGVFRCDEILHEGELGDRSFFLRYDRTVQCFVDEWWIAMGCSVVTIIYYVVGGPVVQYSALRHFHAQKKYKVLFVVDSVQDMAPSDTKHFEPLGATALSMASAGEKSSEASKRSLDAVQSVTVDSKSKEFIFRKGPEVSYVLGSDSADHYLTELDGVQVAVCPVITMIKQDDGSELRYHLTRLDEPNSFQRLYKPFENKYYFWSCVIMLRLFLLTGFVALVQQFNEDYAIPYTLGVSIFFWGVSGQFAAYKNPWCDRVDYLCQSSLMIALFFLSVQQAHGVQESISSFIMFYQVVTSFILLYLIGNVLIQKTRDFRKDLDQLRNLFLSFLPFGIGLYISNKVHSKKIDIEGAAAADEDDDANADCDAGD